jgi:mRNA interferase RelE/StbE
MDYTVSSRENNAIKDAKGEQHECSFLQTLRITMFRCIGNIRHTGLMNQKSDVFCVASRIDSPCGAKVGLCNPVRIGMSLFTRFRAWIIRRQRTPLAICDSKYAYQHHLECIWTPEKSISYAPPATSSYAPPPRLDWKTAFTEAFSKAISGVDRTMQGRILVAIAELSSDPATRRGDTVKPLVGDKHGLWRYRLGGYRLLYEPQVTGRMVVLVDFAPRASVYK